MGIKMTYRVKMESLDIEANCLQTSDGNHKSFPVEIASIEGIDMDDPNCVPAESRETFQRILRSENTLLELESVTITPRGPMLHYVSDLSDNETEDVIIGPWLNKDISISVRVGREDDANPDEYHIRTFSKDDGKTFYLHFGYKRGDVVGFADYEEDGYLRLEEMRP